VGAKGHIGRSCMEMQFAVTAKQTGYFVIMYQLKAIRMDFYQEFGTAIHET
jgi:hypothetical protein